MRAHSWSSQKIWVLFYLEIRRGMSCMICKSFLIQMQVCVPSMEEVRAGASLAWSGEKGSSTGDLGASSRFRFYKSTRHLFTGMFWLLLLWPTVSPCSFLSRPCGEYHKHVGTDGESISLLLLRFQVWGGSLLRLPTTGDVPLGCQSHPH